MKVDPGDREIYRRSVRAADLLRCRAVVKETDLLILSECEIREQVRDILITERDRLERYIVEHPGFRESLVPVAVSVAAPAVVRLMANTGRAAGVGPMAAVAGAICEMVARGLAGAVRELVLENGGDIYLATARERLVGIFAGEDVLGRSIGLRVRPEQTPIGICTSSGRIGHSLSFGDSAAATVTARSCALADAAATAVGNSVRGKNGIKAALATARKIPGVLGAVVLRDGQLGVWGEIELVGL